MNALAKTALLGARLLRIAAFSPARLSHVLGSALAASAEVADRSLDLHRFPCVTVEDLLPAGDTDVRAQFALFPRSAASVSVLEFICLALLMKRARAENIFEFGTYKGVSTTQLALNSPSGSRVITLDLPDEPAPTAFEISFAKDAVIAVEPGKGSFVPPDVRGRITFLRQDSARFDETPYAGQMDFVFVDGAHNAPYVKNDSEKGWRMLRAGGIMAWHDCVIGDPDVVRYLLGCPYQPTRIGNTSLAFAVKA